MTILLAYVSDHHAFLAADSCRWDMVQGRKLAPARKLHMTQGSSAFAVGGSNIDRDVFAEQLLSAHAHGACLSDAARTCAPNLFEDKRVLMHASGVNLSQLLIAYYAEARNGSCQIVRHQLSPNVDHEHKISGFSCDGPDTGWLFAFAQAALSHFTTNKGLALDAWAFHVIDQGAKRHPTKVACPAMAVMIRSNGSMVARDDLHPDCWQGARDEFAVMP